jgi:4-amino-4-deoxy-L-arabinose transferase-like glycosyltransferase
MIFIQFYPLGGDWMWHFDYSKVFLSKDWILSGDKTDRTPFYNFIIAYFLPIFGDNFWVAQIINSLISSIFLIPSYLIAKKLFSVKIAWLTLFLLLVSPFMLEVSIYVWSKNLAAFFILACYYFVFKRQINIWFGLSAALSFMTHYYALLYLSPLIIFILVKKNDFKWGRWGLVSAILPLAILISIWFAYGYIIFNNPAPTMFKYYPILVRGSETLKGKTETQIWKEFWSVPFYYHLYVRVVNFSIVSIPLMVVAFQLISAFSPLNVQLTNKIVNFSLLYPTFHYMQTFAGALTLILYFFFLVGFVKLLREKKQRDLLYLISIPFLLALVEFGWICPIAGPTIEPLIPFFVMIGFWEISKRKNSGKWIKLIFVFALVELAIFFYLYTWHIEITKQIAIDRGSIGVFNSYITAYRIFR